MRNILLLLAAMLPAGPATAETHTLSSAEITALLDDHTINGERDGKPWTQLFQHSGVTVYSQGAAISNGFWKAEDDHYCSQWPPGEAWSCYAITRDGGQIYFVSRDGTRQAFSVQP